VEAKETKVIRKPLAPDLSQISNAKPDQQRDIVVVTGGSGFIGVCLIGRSPWCDSVRFLFQASHRLLF
jgi:hypothetical protein